MQLQRVLTLAPTSGFALHVQSQLRTWTADNNHIAQPARGAVSAAIARCGCDAGLLRPGARSWTDVGEFEESFAALLQANWAKRRSLTYDVRPDVRAMANVATQLFQQAMDRIAEGDQTPGPVLHRGYASHRDDTGGADPRPATPMWARSASRSTSDGDGGAREIGPRPFRLDRYGPRPRLATDRFR